MKNINKTHQIILIILVIMFLLGIFSQTTLCNPTTTITNNIVYSHKIQSIIELIDNNEYSKAFANLEQLDDIDECLISFNQKKFDKLLKNYKSILIEEANKYTENGDYAFALNLLNSKSKYYKNDENINALIEYNTIQSRKHNLTEYSGEITILSTNCLLAFPSKALSHKNPSSAQFDQYHITPSEFENILFSLYNNNYILINANLLNQTTNKQKIWLPEGKKPLIFIFNNCSYEDKNKNKGLIDKIILDRNRNLATFTSKQTISERVSYDNEFVTILESFVKTYPDFSFDNAKGVISLNGNYGILGYKTQRTNATSKFEIKKALEVVNKLKKSGWIFACGGYVGQNMDNLSNIEFSKEISSWINEVEPIIGKTELFVFSGNYNIFLNNETYNFKQSILNEYGFNIIFANKDSKTTNSQNVFYTHHIGGQSLRNCDFVGLFDSYQVYDHTNRTKPFNH